MEELKVKQEAPERDEMVEEDKREHQQLHADKPALERALAEERKASSDMDEKLEKRRKKLENMSAGRKEVQAEFEDYKTGAEKRIREAEEYRDRIKMKATEFFELN
ncbi:hypothetical protein SLS60_008481 [Paraconiothyrium brasiliense]|uniref:Nucleotide exchange factor GrpE n=1 Tax=Paraconiothyrium brasiliense TaxID=300254 RepID=A0ABR3R114_9PLEO